MNHEPHRSPYARVQEIGLRTVRWTRGFWAERFAACRDRTVPGLGALMAGTAHSHYRENFRIAAGLSAGRYRGAPFNDGDFYKWLEAACALLAVSEVPGLSRQVEETIGIIGMAQRGDGYLHTRTLIRQKNGDAGAHPFQDPLDFELYNMGHLLTAACVHYRATGCESLLTIACKTADFLDTTFRVPTREHARFCICPSHYMGTVALYRVTGEKRYRDLAQRFLDMRDLIPESAGDDNQDRIPFRQQTEAIGHAVRANYLYAGAADLYAETGDRSLWEPLERIWQNVVEKKISITGGCGALYDGASPDGAEDQKHITRVHQSYGRNYQLPNLTAHNETCASIGSVLWNWRMFLITGEPRFIDQVETALYNSVLSGVSLAGTEFFYVNPLRCLDTLPGELRWPRTRVPYVSSFCCPPNVARTIAEVAKYTYSLSENTLWVNLYGSSTLTTALPDGRELTLSQETSYPWEGRISLRFDSLKGEGAFALKVRIPHWAEGATVHINGEAVRESPQPSTYLTLSRKWRTGDQVELHLPMPPHLIESHPLVEETRNQAAVRRGPLIYCMESADLSPGTHLLDVLLPSDIALTARHDTRLLGGVTVLEGDALIRPSTETAMLYRKLQASPLKTIPVRLIPYFAWGNRGPTEMSVWLPVRWNS